MFDEATKARFMSRIDVRSDDECWPWTGGKNSAGYGVFHPVPGRPTLATRYACAMANNSMPSREIYCLHSCDNPACCNPRHLRWGTPTDNVRDAMARKRHRNPPPAKGNPNPPKGEKVWNQTLTEEKVREIWRLHLTGLTTFRIAELVGAKQHAVADVCRGRSWRHLPGAPTLEQLKAGGARRGVNQFS